MVVRERVLEGRGLTVVDGMNGKRKDHVGGDDGDPWLWDFGPEGSGFGDVVSCQLNITGPGKVSEFCVAPARTVLN